MKLLKFLLIASALCSISFAYTINPINMSEPSNLSHVVSQNPVNAPINFSSISQIEKDLFGKVYAKQSLENRLSRIEKRIFTTTYTNLSDSQRLDNIISNYNKINANPNISLKTLTKTEKKLFGQDYSLNSVQNRVERLEQKLFGAIQSGDIKNRIKSIEIASKNYEETDSIKPCSTINSGFLGGSGSGIFNRGYATGATPSITGFSTFNSLNNTLNSLNRYNPAYNRRMYNHGYMNRHPYHRPYYPQTGMYRGNRRPVYTNSFSDYGGGASVTILD